MIMIFKVPLALDPMIPSTLLDLRFPQISDFMAYAKSVLKPW